ncbi:hypothetical protein GT037_011035 [Alternaria burnsii]|uniref:Uncharacterized protein n=1 Tax=Alternaria burnsii TaxID=1187904 RepID=A0A8H7AX22_9PLEO|nr:uncharacterized protein GT037_011035 [Alternaria burnsii]KAF7670907.1 hypothetical protein GT037_011035 [Alternaria burnsii]
MREWTGARDPAQCLTSRWRFSDDVRIPETATTRWRPKACIHFQQTPSAASGFGEESRAMVRVREVTRLASFLSSSMLSHASRFSLAHNPRLSSVNTLTVHANF